MIADDHALVRRGLIGLLRAHEPGWRFAEAGGLEETLARLAVELPALLVLSLHLPGMRGGLSLRALRAAHPGLRLAVLTGTDDRNTILDCLGAGAHGYMLKSADPEQLLHAVRMVLAGEIYVPPGLASLTGPAPPPAPPVLTARQADVLRLLAEGRSTKEIARTLNLGVGTVKVHLAGVYRALGAHSRMEAVVRAGRVRLPA